MGEGKGFVINIGVSTCRIYKIQNDNSLVEQRAITYSNEPPDNEYFNEIISNIQSLRENWPNNIIIKVIADYNFSYLFSGEYSINDFTWEFYKKTNLFCNFLTLKQTVDNLTKLFGYLTEKTLIVNIGKKYIDLINGSTGKCVSPLVGAEKVEAILENLKCDEIMTEENITQAKEQIRRELEKEVKELGDTFKYAIIIKDELSFMQEFKYPLQESTSTIIEGHPYFLYIDDYKNANREKLFFVNFRSITYNKEKYKDTDKKRIYGFKTGHLLLELIFEILQIELIFPSNLLSIHGNVNSYMWNVVLVGSTSSERCQFLYEAYEMFNKLGANILSPSFDNMGKLLPITAESDALVFRAIDNCDVLFVCNKDTYIGKETHGNICYAAALRKEIIFWSNPSGSRINCIPHEHWKTNIFGGE